MADTDYRMICDATGAPLCVLVGRAAFFVALELLFVGDRVLGPGSSLEATAFDRLLGAFADPVGSRLELPERGVDLAQELHLFIEEAHVERFLGGAIRLI